MDLRKIFIIVFVFATVINGGVFQIPEPIDESGTETGPSRLIRDME